MELIMDYINNNNTINNDVRIFYSTPSKYFTAVKKELMKNNKTLKIEKHIDFYPYADQEYAYWTGYYTSRPYLKGITKQLSNLYLTSSTYLVEMLLYNKIKLQDIQLNQIQKMIGLLQHHDAITGTAKEKVSNDYITKSNKAINDTTSKVISMLANDNYILNSSDVKICLSNVLSNNFNDNTLPEIKIEVSVTDRIVNASLPSGQRVANNIFEYIKFDDSAKEGSGKQAICDNMSDYIKTNYIYTGSITYNELGLVSKIEFVRK
jgi:hypothetical protein